MQPSRVLVAGAGLAGLTAAHELAAHGVAVTLVDARERLGGRVWTVREPFPDGHHAELGGEFIDADHTHMRQLADRYGLELVPVLEGGFTSRVRTDAGGVLLGRASGWQELGAAFAPLIEAYNGAHGDPNSPEVRAMARYSVRDWLRRNNASPEVHAIADTLRGFFVADPDELSALALVDQVAGHGSPSRVGILRIVGGNARLVDALMRDTPATLLLRHAVRAVTQATGGLVVQIEDPHGALQAIDVDAVVLALPSTTLRDVQITPSLPETQRKAIESLRFGRATKVVVGSAGRLLSRRSARAFATDSALGAFWDSTEGQVGTSRAMLTFLGGGSASEPLAERARLGAEHVLDELCWLRNRTPDWVVPPTDLVTTTWERDPLVRGGYAVFAPNFDPAWRPLLARTADRIVFAGEHTSETHQGYMEGAVESGFRAARELLA